jgi:glucose/arabinose dehydrogenase
LYYTYTASGNNTMNRVVRLTMENEIFLVDEKIIVDAIPGASNHNGGRIKFGPDGYLYIGTGDAQEPSRAQDTNSLAGKILRVTDDGSPAPGNPFNNRIYSYGHRNVQGLAWDSNGQLWATEHGRSGALSGLDEVNKIESGKNYGWPEIQGNETRDGMITAAKNSGNTTWAPAGMDYVAGSMYYAGLRGESLYEANVSGSQIPDVITHLKGQYGRLRDVVTHNGMLYITTSNKDGRGSPKEGDDKILRINPEKL